MKVEGLIVIQSDTEDESISYIIFELLNIFAKSNSFICQNSDIRDEDNCTNVDPFYAPPTASTSKRVPVMKTVIDVDDSSDSEPGIPSIVSYYLPPFLFHQT